MDCLVLFDEWSSFLQPNEMAWFRGPSFHAENRPKMAKPCLVQGMHKALVFLDTLWVFRLRQL